MPATASLPAGRHAPHSVCHVLDPLRSSRHRSANLSRSERVHLPQPGRRTRPRPRRGCGCRPGSRPGTAGRAYPSPAAPWPGAHPPPKLSSLEREAAGDLGLGRRPEEVAPVVGRPGEPVGGVVPSAGRGAQILMLEGGGHALDLGASKLEGTGLGATPAILPRPNIFSAIDRTLSQREPCRHSCSKTSRTARSFTSGENFLCAMTPSSRAMESPAKPGRFTLLFTTNFEATYGMVLR